jgi:hypothetical protein
MKVQELVKVVSNNKNKMLKQEQLQEVVKKELNVKKYISIKDKKKIVENIVNECVLYEDGVFKFDEIEKYIVFTMRVIEAYTDIELSDDMEVDYDMLCAAGLLELVVGIFKKEYDDMNVLLKMRCDYILSSNTVESQVGRLLDGLLEKVDVIVNSLSEKIDSFNIDINEGDLKKLLEFVGK